ncbi:uncharacterized protein PAC_02032 [Phialocephala subalpina]|uniref:Uncharacterized protein n=1 Tax=Phialocephala subalpina TaxID=576137 RepID=A0A1L7WHC2_9HELO|nr:uncharacterized protein PAC_02032 [Phialocephala subalpina]
MTSGYHHRAHSGFGFAARMALQLPKDINYDQNCQQWNETNEQQKSGSGEEEVASGGRLAYHESFETAQELSITSQPRTQSRVLGKFERRLGGSVTGLQEAKAEGARP